MGLISQVLSFVFGNDRNVIRDTVEVFRENTEAGAARAQTARLNTLEQFGAEFQRPRRGIFDRVMDAVNRLPRPALALGTLALFVSAMVDPLWFAARMQGIALVPEPLWWLLGVIVSFYFGARHQMKAQDFQRDVAVTMARVPQAIENISQLQQLRADSPGIADPKGENQLEIAVAEGAENPALEDWKVRQRA